LKLLLDEMYTGLKDHLEVMGWEVKTVKEDGMSGSEDRRIAEYAREHGFLLVTQDQKPAELAELMKARYIFITSAAVAQMVDREIKKKYPVDQTKG
jgi:predicted nuclease of predicted toxin-antitoxin system